MAITIIVKQGRSDARRYSYKAPWHTPAGMEQHEQQEWARKAKASSKAKRARGSGKRPEVEIIGNAPLKVHLEMRKRGMKPTEKNLREIGALFPDA